MEPFVECEEWRRRVGIAAAAVLAAGTGVGIAVGLAAGVVGGMMVAMGWEAASGGDKHDE